MERKLFIESQTEIKKIIQSWLDENNNWISEIILINIFYLENNKATAIVEYYT